MILRRTLDPRSIKDAFRGDNRHKVKKMNTRPEVLYGSDFETNPPKDGVVNVWLWSIVRASDGAYIVGETIEEWYEEVMKLNGVVCFHNLKFDSAFILYWLEANHVEYDKESTIIDASMHIPYRIALKPDLYIQDTMRVHNTSLEKLAKSYGLEGKTEKADFTVFHEYGCASDHDIEYVIQDSNIVAQVLKMDCIANNGYIPITGAGYAMKRYKEWFKNTPLATPVTRRGQNPMDGLFPQSYTEDEPYSWQNFARMSYMGGLCIVADGYESKVNGKTWVYDVNSAYPYHMSSKQLPVGMGGYVSDYQPEMFGIYYVRCTFDHAGESCPIVHKCRAFGTHLPYTDDGMDNSLTLYGQSDYIEAYNGTLVLTSIEIDYLMRRANLMMHVIGGYVFNTRDDVFRDYIKPIYEERQRIKKTDPVRAEFLKLSMNSLYGKFGTDVKYGFVNGIDEDGEYFERVDLDDESFPWSYVPIATAITGYERVYIADIISDNWSGFVYTDTDSIHLDRPHVPGSMNIHPTELGALKCESVAERSKYIRPKCYVHEVETEFNNDGTVKKVKPIEVKCGGMPANVKEQITSMDELHIDAVFEGKLMPKHYKGGVYLQPGTYRINNGYRM